MKLLCFDHNLQQVVKPQLLGISKIAVIVNVVFFFFEVYMKIAQISVVSSEYTCSVGIPMVSFSFIHLPGWLFVSYSVTNISQKQ